MLTKVIISFVAILAFSIFDALSDAFHIQERINSDKSSEWHIVQAARQSVIILFIAIYLQRAAAGLIAAAIFWIIHDGVVNIVALNQSWFYVGKTAQIDKLFQKLPVPEISMFITKLAALAAGLYFYFR